MNAQAPSVATRRSAHASFLVAAAAVSALTVVACQAAAQAWPAGAELLVLRGTGWTATAALLLGFACAPLRALAARMHTAEAYYLQARRALGMGAACLALLHAALALALRLKWNFAAVVEWPHLRAGGLALLILVVLLATSFAPVVAALRIGLVKELHRLSYPAALLALQHLLLSPFAPRAFSLACFAIALLLGRLPRRRAPRT